MNELNLEAEEERENDGDQNTDSSKGGLSIKSQRSVKGVEEEYWMEKEVGDSGGLGNESVSTL